MVTLFSTSLPFELDDSTPRVTVLNAQERLKIAEERSRDAQERLRESRARQGEADERYVDSLGSVSFREGRQALKDYVRAGNDNVRAIMDKAYADRDRRVERENAAREARENNSVQDSRDWRRDARDKLVTGPEVSGGA